ncbi:unnamed protein product [Nyctereutes procyonoides]|uniref:(raccoon dog) hypothetical protein n=1 Tax=Nyctereutes procyonoides TaxID=34880 RepID=A0A811YC92_NYCPR|nr:unnamed protein product [Nyctereutes procyonoides]
MQSLKSQTFLLETYQEGIQYLCDYFHLPPEIVPATLHHSSPNTGRPQPKGLEGE